MRKITLTVLLLSALSFFAQAQEKTFSISGKIELDKGNLLVLTQRPGKIDTLAKTAIANRQFSISGTTEEAVVAQLVIEGYAGGFVMILEPGEEYTANLTQNGNGDIRGGKLQTAYNEYQKIVVNANAESRALNKKHRKRPLRSTLKPLKSYKPKQTKFRKQPLQR